MIPQQIFDAYENNKLIKYTDDSDALRWVPYDELPTRQVTGVLKADTYIDGRLMQLYSSQESHVGVIAATRLGKTTSYGIPTIISNARRSDKRSMIISDPKGELYRHTSQTLREEGYRVYLLNFRDHTHSECWNMLTPIYRKYQKVYSVYDEVGVVTTEKGPRNTFRGEVYESERKLKRDIARVIRVGLDSVAKDIDDLAAMFITTQKADDPYWEDSARDVLKAFLWAMLEDSREDDLAERPECDYKKVLITEEKFSFNTILSILSMFHDERENRYNDGGFFSNRKPTSRSLMLAKNSFIENAPVTRKCVMSTFNSKIAIFRDSAMRLITGCNSFEFDSLADGPVAVYIDYRDEIKAHYQIISLFVQNTYKLLIERANASPEGKLPVPFYFILDEFGNFPPLRDFETTISACAGRNIFFILIMQSYAQLNSVDGENVDEIIRDNLNIHIFFGSNNIKTLQEFSRECGEMTRISPLSALNGGGKDIESFQIETIPLISKSRLARFEPGECVVTEANSGYVLWSRLERYYNCPEFSNLPKASEHDYVCPVNAFDEKYICTLEERRRGF